MNEHDDTHHHSAPADGKKYWLDNPKNVQLIWYGLIGVCALLFVVDFFVEKHPHYAIENAPNFYGFYGFFGCVFLVLTAAQLRKILMRKETYYEEIDERFDKKNAPGADGGH